MFDAIKKWIDEKIDAMFGDDKPERTVSNPVTEEKPAAPVKTRPTLAQLKRMNKTALEKLGREHGVELDRRLRHDKLVDQLDKIL